MIISTRVHLWTLPKPWTQETKEAQSKAIVWTGRSLDKLDLLDLTRARSSHVWRNAFCRHKEWRRCTSTTTMTWKRWTTTTKKLNTEFWSLLSLLQMYAQTHLHRSDSTDSGSDSSEMGAPTSTAKTQNQRSYVVEKIKNFMWIKEFLTSMMTNLTSCPVSSIIFRLCWLQFGE